MGAAIKYMQLYFENVTLQSDGSIQFPDQSKK